MANLKVWIAKGANKEKGDWYKIEGTKRKVWILAKDLAHARITWHKATGGEVVEDIILAKEEEADLLNSLKFK